MNAGHVMINPDDPRSWLAKAEEDLLCIDNNLNARQTPWAAVCYHAQQAAEKAFKACLVWKNIDPPRTHDLVKLLEIMDEAGVDLWTMRDACVALSAHAMRTRYPGDARQLGETDARWAAEKAHEAVDAVVRLLALPKDVDESDA